MSGTTVTEAFFLDESGDGFCIRFRPLASPRLHLVFLPALGEEMNRCRALVAAQARWFARQGICCSLVDYTGTGESRREIEDAGLDEWRADVDRAAASLVDAPGCPLVLWGMRLGALLALDYGARHPASLAAVLLWQPVVSGKRYVSWLRRQHRAGRIQALQDPIPEGREAAAAHGDETGVEIGGYGFTGALLDDIAALSVEGLAALPARDVRWLEHTDAPAEGLSGAARNAIERLRTMGASVDELPFTGDPVWQLHKRGQCRHLLERTRELDLWTR